MCIRDRLGNRFWQISLKQYFIQCAARISRHSAISQAYCVCVDSLHWLPVITVTKLPRGYFATKTCPLLLCALPFRMWMELQFLIIFEVWALVFEAQAVILKAWGPMWTFSGMVVWFYRKKCVRGSPPKVSMDPLFAVSRGVLFFFECSCFWICVTLSAQRLHSGFHFDSFWGALGLLKNSWKCISVINFRGLTPLGRSLFPGLDRECVLRLSFYRNFRFGMVWGSLFWILLGPIVVKKSV